ncbi:MAG: PAS domain S-box protein [Candidatus Poribacteria bacterium]|nr:PAS domain S-box protein [Candidatus Poribacteria bacterium]
MASAKVLIVEHIPFVAQDLAGRLKKAGYSVCASVASDAQAEGKVEEISPDIAIINVELQKPDIQLIKKINSRFKIPVVWLIGELTEELIEQLSDAFQFECVFQPHDTNQLRLSIEKSLRRHRKLQQLAEKETELKSTIQRLEERVGFMKVIFDNISDGVIASNVNGDYFMFNPTAEELNGPGMPSIPFAERSETYGLFHADGETLFKEEELPLVRAIRGEMTDNIEMYVRNEKRPEGVRINVSGRPLYDINGELKGGVVVTHDVTQLKDIENELRETISKLENQTKIMETIVSTIADGVIAMDFDGNNLLYNAPTEQVTGSFPVLAELNEWSEIYQVYHLDGETMYTADELPLVRALRGESTDNALMQVRRENKTYVLNVNGRPLFDERGNLSGGVAVFSDITQLKATEARLEFTIQELKQQTRLMETAFDSISDGVVVMDSSARILLANPSLQRMSGVKVEDAPPEEWAQKYGLFHIDEETEVPTHENLLVRALNGEESEEMEFFLQNDKKRGKTYLRAKAYPLHGNDSTEVTGAIAVIRDITSDKMAMTELQQMMQKYQEQAQLMDTVFNSLSEGIIVTDKMGKFLFVNPMAEQITGLGAIAATPEKWSELYGVFYPDTVTPYPSNELPLVLAMQGKDSTDVDLFLRNSERPDGAHIRVTGRPLFDENGALRGGVSVLRNITKLKSVENRLAKTVEELQSQTLLLNTIFNSIGDGLIVANDKGQYVMFNRTVEGMVGRKLENLTQAPEKYGLFLPDNKTIFPFDELPIARALRGEEVTEVEMVVRNQMLPDGVHVSISANPLLNESGEIEGGVAIARDITRIKRTEQQLKDSINQLEHQRQLMQSIFDSISDGVVVADENGHFTIFNPSAERIVGQGATDTEPDEWSDQYGLFFPDRETPFPPEELPLVKAIRGEGTDSIEMFVRNPKLPDGLYISVSGRPLRDRNGNRKGGVVVFRDVSDKIFAEEALAQAFSQGRLEIVDTILHNIGNAINSVVTGIGTLNSRLTENRLIHRFNALADAIRANQDDWIDYIKHNPQGQKVLPFVLALAEDFTKQNEDLINTVERVNNRATHIVDIVRTQKSFSDTSAVRKDVDLKKIINDGVKLLQDSLDKRGIQLDIDCQKAPQEIRIQESQFHQMIVNLIKNSVEAIDELGNSGGIAQPPRIEVKAYLKENHLCIDVTDNGVGIENTKFKTIFAAGYTTKASGSGLGLHSTANFVVGSGGKIYPLSEGIGKGTTMRVMLRLDSIIP